LIKKYMIQWSIRGIVITKSVVILLERQMARIDDLESYMKENLGSDWSQLKNLR